MSKRCGWRRFLLCAVLEFAALTGVPLRPKDIEDALRSGATTSIHQKYRDDTDEPEPVLPSLLIHDSCRDTPSVQSGMEMPNE